MKTLRTIALLTVAAFLQSCFKDVADRTLYILKPLVQEASGDATVPLDGVKAYAFAADSTLWTVASYADAEAGIATSKTDPSKRLDPSAAAEPYAGEEGRNWMQMELGSSPKMILVVDTEHRIYGYTQQNLTDNLPRLYVSVVFKPWKEGKSYKDGVWSFYSPFYEPPVFVDCFIDAQAQIEEGGQTAPPASLKAYAYAVDTTAWRIASYDDAVAGIITSKSDPEQTRDTPGFEAYKEDSGLYRLSASSTPLMVVVVDRTNRMYAYSKQEVDFENETQTFPPVVFRPWQKTWYDVQEPWRVVNEKYAPGDPGNDPDDGSGGEGGSGGTDATTDGNRPKRDR